MAVQTISEHHCSVTSFAPQRATPSGSRIDIRSTELPALKGEMSLSLLTLRAKAVREPHWHPNACELSYCLEGSALMTIFSPGNGHDTFAINPGDIAFVPRGYLHHIVNTSEKSDLKMLLCFDTSDPEDIDISAGVSAMPNHVMAETFTLSREFFGGLKKTDKGVFASQLKEIPRAPKEPTPDRYRMALEHANPLVVTKGGCVKFSNGFYMPTLEGLAVYSVLLKPGGAREPHWHPNANELNYLIKGQARITLLSPGGGIDTFDMKAGDMSFLPRGYLHYIENIGSDDAHFAIFFDHSFPSDMGISGSLGAYSNEVLASIFGVAPSYFDTLPKLQEDVFIVGGG